MDRVKIAMIWDYNPEFPDAWCSPYSIFRHLRDTFSFEMRQYCLLKGRQTKAFEDYMIDDFDADVIILFNAGPIPGADRWWKKDVLKKSKPPFLIQEAGDEPQCYGHTLSFSGNSDLVLTPDLRCADLYHQRGVSVEWMTHWCDETVFYKDSTTPQYDVVSSMFGYRPRAEQIHKLMGGKFVNRNGLNGSENGDWLRQGKIILQDSRYQEITRRVFEGMGCGRMVLTDRIPEHTGIYSLFEDKKDIVYYSSPEEAVELANYYLTHDEEREKIAQSGYNKVIGGHTSFHRAKTISQEIRRTYVDF